MMSLRPKPGTRGEKFARSRAGRAARRSFRRWRGHKPPHEVFTSTGSPDRLVYADRKRESIQDKVQRCLQQRNTHVAVVGPSGVGKTALVHYVIESLRLTPYWAEHDAGKEDQALSVLLDNLIARLGAGKRAERTEKKTHESRGSVKAGGLSKGATASEGSETKRLFASQSPISQVVDALQESEIDVFFIDDFEWLVERSDENLVYDVVKRLVVGLATGRTKRPVTVVLACPERHIDRLMQDEKAASRISVIKVPRMQQVELGEILTRAEDEMGLVFTSEARVAISEASDGLPGLTHQFGEYAALHARKARSTLVLKDHFYSALEDMLAEQGPLWRGAKAYERALEKPGGSPHYRRIVMDALATSADFEVPRAVLVAAYQGALDVLGDEADVPLDAPLGELVEGKTLIERDERILFRLPYVRTYIRCLNLFPDYFNPVLEVESRHARP
jgi:type II secretory pathway predicted ATPase ExeA